jgi:hypothetical protein
MARAILRSLLGSIVFLALGSAVGGQRATKSWLEWSKEDAEKILNDSAWGRTQTETDTSEMFYNPTTQGGRGDSTSRRTQGATNEAVSVNFRIRFFTAKPVRQALVRLFEIQRKPDAEAMELLRSFADISPSSLIIVTVSFESPNQQAAAKMMQAFASAVTGTLKNSTYLERRDGKRLFLEEYVPPGRDGFGARFIFSRFVDEKPFLDQQSGEVRFYCELKDLKLNMKYRVSDMLYGGKLEY